MVTYSRTLVFLLILDYDKNSLSIILSLYVWASVVLSYIPPYGVSNLTTSVLPSVLSVSVMHYEFTHYVHSSSIVLPVPSPFDRLFVSLDTHVYSLRTFLCWDWLCILWVSLSVTHDDDFYTGPRGRLVWSNLDHLSFTTFVSRIGPL